MKNTYSVNVRVLEPALLGEVLGEADKHGYFGIYKSGDNHEFQFHDSNKALEFRDSLDTDDLAEKVTVLERAE